MHLDSWGFAHFLAAIGLAIVIYAIFFGIIFATFGMKVESGVGMAIGVLLVALLFVAASLFLGVKRVTNLGMSGWVVLWSLVPFMNIWIHWRMMACPAGYEDHRTLDTAGKVISGLSIVVLALGFFAPLIGGLARGGSAPDVGFLPESVASAQELRLL